MGYDALRVLIPYEELQRTVIAAAALSPGERLLVAGCGTGNLEWLAARQVPDLCIDAVDFSAAMLQRARGKCAAWPAVRHYQADLCAALPLPSATADAAVMCNVLYALPDQAAALREIGRVLRPGGRLILCDRQPWSAMQPIVRAHLSALRGLRAPARWAHGLRTLGALPRLSGFNGVTGRAPISICRSRKRTHWSRRPALRSGRCSPRMQSSAGWYAPPAARLRRCAASMPRGRAASMPGGIEPRHDGCAAHPVCGDGI